MNRNFDDDIKFNKYQLEEVCEKHASIYWYWANKLAEAKNALGDSEDKFKLTSAQREMYIRQNWDDSKGKSTEASIKAALESDRDYISAKEEIRNNQHEVNTLIAAVSAFDHRKGMIDNEVKLLIGGFYATPNGGKKEDANDQAARELRRKKNSK